MEECFLYGKDESVYRIVEKIMDHFGTAFFETEEQGGRRVLVDYWDADRFAVGLKREEKLAWISSWDSRDKDPDQVLYALGFEIVSLTTGESLQTVQVSEDAAASSVLSGLKLFFEGT